MSKFIGVHICKTFFPQMNYFHLVMRSSAYRIYLVLEPLTGGVDEEEHVFDVFPLPDVHVFRVELFPHVHPFVQGDRLFGVGFGGHVDALGGRQQPLPHHPHRVRHDLVLSAVLSAQVFHFLQPSN